MDKAAIRQACKSVQKGTAGETKLDKLCSHLVTRGSITRWQCDNLRAGRFKGFIADKYILIDRISAYDNTYLAVDTDSGEKVRLRYAEGYTEYRVLDVEAD